MTELRKGQRVWVEAEVVDPEPDVEGDITLETRCGPEQIETAAAYARPSAVRAEHPGPTYLARREAMVRAKLEAGHFGSLEGHESMIEKVDALLRAIDETPVPEWAGGEHE